MNSHQRRKAIRKDVRENRCVFGAGHTPYERICIYCLVLQVSPFFKTKHRCPARSKSHFIL